jgi:hypothetical protein
MNASKKSAARALLRGVSWILFAVAGGAFWVGGRAISEFGKIDRVVAEIEGLCLAIVSGALGLWAKSTADDFDKGEESDSLE